MNATLPPSDISHRQFSRYCVHLSSYVITNTYCRFDGDGKKEDVMPIDPTLHLPTGGGFVEYGLSSVLVHMPFGKCWVPPYRSILRSVSE